MTPSVSPNSWPADGHSPLTEFFRSIHPLDPAILSYVDKHSFPVFVRKGNYLMQPGSEKQNLYLLIKGVMRGYLLDQQKEITTWINEEFEIVGSIRSLGLDKPNEEFIEAIEDSWLVGIPYSTIEFLYEKYPEANIIGRKVLEESYRDAEERAFISRIPSAELKYKRFLETKGDLINRIPLKFIASYLGMTLETLSRIRSRMR